MADPHFYADQGSIAHMLAAMCLTEKRPASAYVGRLLRGEDYEHAKLSPSTAHRWMRCVGSHALETRAPFKPRKFSYQVDEDMAAAVQKYVDHINAKVERRDAMLFVEQRVPIGHITGEEGAEGTSDTIILDFDARELSATDLKFGQGVEVSAIDNEQLKLYMLGAKEKMAEFEPEGGWQIFHGEIFQPRINDEPSTEDWTLKDLEEFAEEASAKATVATNIKTRSIEWIDKAGYLVPGEKQCNFCSAKATCPALRRHMEKMVAVELSGTDHDKGELAPIPADETKLARLKRWTPLLRSWCDAVDSHIESIMLAGRRVPGWKVVQGRKGNRSWVDETEAEAAMKAMRLKQEEMYSMKLISPTQAEKLVDSKTLGDRQWQKLQKLVTQAPGKPTVVPEDDKRPALDIKPVSHELGVPQLPPPDEDDLV